MKISALQRFLSLPFDNTKQQHKILYDDGLNSMNHRLGMQSEIFLIIKVGANCRGLATDTHLVSQKAMVLGAWHGL